MLRYLPDAGPAGPARAISMLDAMISYLWPERCTSLLSARARSFPIERDGAQPRFATQDSHTHAAALSDDTKGRDMSAPQPAGISIEDPRFKDGPRSVD